jgi:hypothetical protein
MSIDVKSNCFVPSDNASVLYRLRADGVELSSSYSSVRVGIRMSAPAAGSATAAFRFETGSGITTQTSGSLTMTKKIAIIDDAGNTIYIQAGTIA